MNGRPVTLHIAFTPPAWQNGHSWPSSKCLTTFLINPWGLNIILLPTFPLFAPGFWCTNQGRVISIGKFPTSQRHIQTHRFPIVSKKIMHSYGPHLHVQIDSSKLSKEGRSSCPGFISFWKWGVGHLAMYFEWRFHYTLT